MSRRAGSAGCSVRSSICFTQAAFSPLLPPIAPPPPPASPPEEHHMTNHRFHRPRQHGQPDGRQPRQGAAHGAAASTSMPENLVHRARRRRRHAAANAAGAVEGRRGGRSPCCRPASMCSRSRTTSSPLCGRRHAADRLLDDRRRDRAQGACDRGRAALPARSTRRSPAAPAARIGRHADLHGRRLATEAFAAGRADAAADGRPRRALRRRPAPARRRRSATT